jgi:GAF domain-containing protein/ANTAR domain-containing protein
VAIPSTSPRRPGQPGAGLRDGLITLAGMPDDDSSVPALLRSITQFAVDLLPAVSYASTTVHDKDAYATVAMSSEVALAVDEAQYAARTGPCLDALETTEPTALPQIDSTVRWPHFRQAARRFGLRASLSVPLFAGQGSAIAALNLYSRDTKPMAPLCAAVVATFAGSTEAGSTEAGPARAFDDLGSGPLQLLDGLTGAFRVRATIQQALGVIMAEEQTSSTFAYAILRAQAAATAMSLPAAAGCVLTEAGER